MCLIILCLKIWDFFTVAELPIVTYTSVFPDKFYHISNNTGRPPSSLRVPHHPSAIDAQICL